MGLTLITPPEDEPLTLIEVKQHLGVEHDEQDTLIGLYLAAARQWIDGPSWLGGRTLMPQTWELVLDAFPTHEIALPLTPVQSITSITYDDADGNSMLVDGDEYYLDKDSNPAWLVPLTDGWPTTLDAVNAVRIRFVAGYADAAAVPAPIKAALLLLVGHLFSNREEVAQSPPARSQLPVGAHALLSPWRILYC